MRRLLLLSFGLFLFALPSRAQSVDASVGYSCFRLGGSGGIKQNGVSGSVSYNPNRWLGIVGDFGGYHASPGGVSLNTYTYLFGVPCGRWPVEKHGGLPKMGRHAV